MKNPYKASEGDVPSPVYPTDGGRLFARRSLAWVIDGLVFPGSLFLFAATIVNFVYVQDEFRRHLLLDFGLSILFGGWALMSVIGRTPGLIITGLQIEHAGARVGRFLRASRVFGLPFIAVAGAVNKVIWDMEWTEFTISYMPAIMGVVGVSMAIVGPLLCLSRSGLSPLDRMFGMRIVRKN